MTARSEVFDEGYQARPFERYAELHDTGEVVHPIRTPEGLPAWFVTGYREVRELLADGRLSRNLNRPRPRSRIATTRAMPLPAQFTTGTVASLDGPEHTRLRGFLSRSLSARRVRPFRPRVEAVVANLLEALPAGQADLMDALAVPLSITVIGDLFGVPIDERHQVQHMLDVIAGLDPTVGYDNQSRRAAGQQAIEWLRALIRQRRAEPGDDVVSEWVRCADSDGAPLTDDDVIGLAFAFLLGGYDTTVGMVGAVFLALLGEPGAYSALCRQPQDIPDVVERLLREHGVLHTTRRYAVADLEVGGCPVRAGDVVLLSIAAAGRDPRRFGPDAPGGSHLAFGHGPHYCPGAELARMELVVTLEHAVHRLPALALRTPADQVPWRPTHFVRVPTTVPVSY